MRASETRMVIVVDEHGAVVGIATLEDLFEEVVGELVGRWETDAVDVVAPDAAVVRGWTTVSHLNETLGLSLPADAGAETVAGLVPRQDGRLPSKSDRVAVGNVTRAVTGATATRVTRTRVEHADENGFASDEGSPPGDADGAGEDADGAGEDAT
jgi:CBS domain containing-hemolysin-like protein